MDGQSICDVCINEALVTNIRPCKWTLHLETQSRSCYISKIADMRGVGIVWFFRDGVANIISQFRIAVHSKCDISYSTGDYKKSGRIEDLAYKVKTSEGIKCKFTPTEKGPYVLKIDKKTNGCFFGREIPDNETNFGMAMCHTMISDTFDEGIGVDGRHDDESITGVIEANTVEHPTIVHNVNNDEEVAIVTLEDSKKRFSKRDRLKAELVRRFQHVAGVPSDATLIHLVTTNGIRNNPITKRDILIAHEMLARSKYAAKGKTKRCQPSAVDMHQQTVEVPRVIKEYYSNVELSTNVMYLNNIPFITSISEHIHYGTTRVIDNITCLKLENELKNVIRSYTVRSFRVVLILVDIQFKALKDRNAVGVAFNIVAQSILLRLSVFTK